jgi:dTDP-4-amino-4,6-dideoxygalactose transaminase
MSAETEQGAVTFGQPLIEEASIAEVVDSLRSGWIGTGAKVARFERMLADYITVPDVCCVSSATAGLCLVLRALGIGPGDEVLMPSMTFAATAQAVEYAGAVPVPVDSEPRTNLISLEAAERAITPCTRAVLIVHLAGRPVDLEAAGRLGERHDIHIVEDAAHAIGARFDGLPIGASGNPTVFSFDASKNITSIAGGAVTAADQALVQRVRTMSQNGVDRSAWRRFSEDAPADYDVVAPGFKFTMSDVHAAVGLHQLPQLERWTERRAALWHRYDRELSDLPLELPVPPTARMRHARHLYQVRVTDDAPLTRDELAARLRAAAIGSGIHYRALHLHSHFRERYRLQARAFPVATDASRRLLSLPLHPGLSDDDHARVVAELHASLEAQ